MIKLQRLMKFLVCIGLLTAFLGCAATSKHESTGQYVDNAAITAKVKAAIFDDATLKVLQINVETFKGVVQLSGFVDSSANASRAVQLAKGVEGVTEVKNDMVVK